MVHFTAGAASIPYNLPYALDRSTNVKGVTMSISNNLAPGAKGDMVKSLQHALIAHGYSVGPAGPNGVFDDATTSALEAFQDNAALPVQPRCDKATWAALGPK